MYNIMMYVIEDDINMSSSFFMDFQNLMVKNSKIPIHIIYRSLSYFGNLSISIKGNHANVEKLHDISLQYDNIKEEITSLYKKHYKKDYKNIFIYGGHVYYLYKDTDQRWVANTIFENLKKLELMIIDSCYSTRLGLLNTIQNSTNYLIACQSNSAHYGFVTEDFINILNSKNDNDLTRYKAIIDLYIQRNSIKTKPYSKFITKTDGILIDLSKIKSIIKKMNDDTKILKKKRECRIELSNGYNYYDYVCSTDNKHLIRKLKESVLYRKYNYDKNKNFSGVSIEI